MEYSLASNRLSPNKFAHILSQHALVMVDVAKPGLNRHSYVQLGMRLGDVQTNWVNLLCSGLENTVQPEQDKEYRRVVTNVVRDFTNQLSEMLLEDKIVGHDELVAHAGQFHSMHSAKAERSVAETNRLFCMYVDCLAQLYQCKTKQSHQQAATDCLTVGHALGAWLDATIF